MRKTRRAVLKTQNEITICNVYLVLNLQGLTHLTINHGV